METFLSHCMTSASAALAGHGGMLGVFFVGGLMGGFTHCLTMCGPLVGAQVAACGGCGSCNKREAVVRASQLSYHSGRMLTYGALGFGAAALAKHIAAFSFWPALSAVMLALAGLSFIVSSLPRCHGTHSWMPALGNRSQWLRGMLMGFMPCGLIYAALMMAATLANPLAGMVAMWLFVLGTMPALLLASVGAEFLSRARRQLMSNVGRVAMAFNGLSLLVMAAHTMR